MYLLHHIQMKYLREFMVIRNNHTGQVILFDQFVVCYVPEKFNIAFHKRFLGAKKEIDTL